MNERRRVKPHEKDVICFSEVRVEPSHPRKRLVASRSVASAFTSEQQRHSATFFGEETQQNERAGDFYKKSRRKRYEACGDVVDPKGIEPSTSALRTRRSPS